MLRRLVFNLFQNKNNTLVNTKKLPFIPNPNNSKEIPLASFTKSLTLSTLLGYLITKYTLDNEVIDNKLEPVYHQIYSSVNWLNSNVLSKMGFQISSALAFSTPDHGLHSPHYPWEHDKWWKTYDHKA